MQTDDLAYFNSEGFRNILRQYEESAKSGHPIYMDADDLADIADYYQYNGHPDEAEEAINLALSYNPQAVGPLLYKAREALTHKDYDTARSYAERIEASDMMEAIFLRGEILICEGMVDKADKLFQQYMEEIMSDELMDYVYNVANTYSEYAIYDKAFEWMARSQGDNSDEFKELMACTLFGLGKYQDSERIFNELIDHNPYSTRYWNALANAQFMQEDYSSAITSSEYAIAIDPNDAEGLMSKANSLYNLENYDEALTYFKRYSEKMPDDEFGYLHQGMCLINTGKYNESTKVLLKALELAEGGSVSPCLAEIYQELAFAYNELHQPQKALHCIDKTNDLDCDHVSMQIIRGHVLLGDHRLKEAEVCFRKAIADSDYSPHIMLRIIVSLYDNHYIRIAYMLLNNLLKHADEDWKDGYSYMALCCLEMEKNNEFLYYLKLGCEKSPKEARMVLGNYFPANLEPKDYYDYTINKIRKESK